MTVRVALAGLGAHAAKTVLPAIEASPSWELAGVVSSRPDAARETADGLGVEAYPDLGAAIADGVDAVYLATVPARHAEACHEAIAAGVPLVVCEKPLGVNGAEADGLAAAARGAGTALYEVMAYQHHPQFAEMERLLASEEVGGLVHGYARFSYPFMPEGDYRYRPADGGGSLLDAGIYPLSLAARLMGGAAATVQAALHRGRWDVDVSGSATLTDAEGRSFQCSWGMGSAYANLARLIGPKGTVVVSRPFSKPAPFDEPIVHIGGWGDTTEVAYEPADQFVAMFEDLAAGHTDPAWREEVLAGIEARWAILEQVRSGAIAAG